MLGKTFTRALALATVLSLAMTGVVSADNAVADGDAVTPVTNQDMAFGNVSCNVATAKTALIAISRNGSATGTNTFANSAEVTVNVLSVSGTGLSASIDPAANEIDLPSNWTTLDNNTLSGTVSASVSLTSTAGGAGSGTVTFRATGINTSGDTINRDDAMAVSWTTGSCPPANTAPSVSVTGVADGATYEFGSVPTPACSVEDAEDTGESATPIVGAISGPLSAYGLGSQQVTCSYTDGGGLSDSDSATYTIVDTGAPTIDDLGATAGPDGSNGWYITAVTNQFRASDSGAGFVSPLPNPYTFTQSSGTNEGSAVKIASGTVSDVAGNTAASIDSAAFKIDRSDPTNIAFVGGPAAGSSHYFGSVPAAPTCTADDAISQLETCLVTGHSTAVGTHTMRATATDNAGRTAWIERSYTVLAWTATGFYSPVDMNDVLNTVKAGSTVPLKFELFAGTTEFTTTDKIKSFTVTKSDCSGFSGAEDLIETYSTGGTSLRYDSTAGQFIQNWQVPKGAGVCYRVTLTAQDNVSTLVAFFKTK